MKLPFSLVEVIIAIVKSIFVQEHSDKTGPEKEEAVLSAVPLKTAGVGGWLEYLKYFTLLSGLIKVIIQYLNDNLGHDWGNGDDADKK